MSVSRAIRWLTNTGIFAVTAYAGYVAVGWLSYGRGGHTRDGEGDALLERLLPGHDVGERLQMRIAAPAAVTFQNLCTLNLLQSSLVQAIFRIREMAMGGDAQQRAMDVGLVDQAKLWGWRMLAVQPGVEIVFGAVTQPWVAHPIFHGLTADQFMQFAAPGWVKIAWTLRVDPVDAVRSIASTETRVVATDQKARAKFRVYWALVAPGTLLIRFLALRQLKARSERTAST